MIETFSRNLELLAKNEHAKLDLTSDAIDSIQKKTTEVYALFRQAFDFVNDTPELKEIYDFMLGACDFDDITELLDLDVDPTNSKRCLNNSKTFITINYQRQRINPNKSHFLHKRWNY